MRRMSVVVDWKMWVSSPDGSRNGRQQMMLGHDAEGFVLRGEDGGRVEGTGVGSEGWEQERVGDKSKSRDEDRRVEPEADHWTRMRTAIATQARAT